MFFTGWRDGNGNLTQVLALHEIETRQDIPGRMARVASDAGGRKSILVRQQPVLTSRNIVAAELQETDDPRRPAVRLLLDRRGALIWMQTCHQMPGQSLALLIDGFFVCTLPLPHRFEEPDSILIIGPWGRGEADTLVEKAARNYKRLNGSAWLR